MDHFLPFKNRSLNGLTLVEIMVAISLIAVSLMLVLALIPAGIQSAQRSENIQSATAWSRQLIETAPVPSEFPIPNEIAVTEHETKIGNTRFEGKRTLSLLPGKTYLYRIEVEINWSEATRPLTISVSKFNPAGPQP